MAFNWSFVKKMISLVMLLGLIAVAQGSRPLLGSTGVSRRNLKTFSMEMEDLSLQEQQKVIDFGGRLEAATRQLLGADPYATKY